MNSRRFNGSSCIARFHPKCAHRSLSARQRTHSAEIVRPLGMFPAEATTLTDYYKQNVYAHGARDACWCRQDSSDQRVGRQRAALIGITGPSPKALKRRTEALELACVDVQDPQHVGGMLRKLAETLLILPDSLFCAFLRIYNPEGLPPPLRSHRPRCERAPHLRGSKSHVRRRPCE
jgi:hypothetical protein